MRDRSWRRFQREKVILRRIRFLQWSWYNRSKIYAQLMDDCSICGLRWECMLQSHRIECAKLDKWLKHTVYVRNRLGCSCSYCKKDKIFRKGEKRQWQREWRKIKSDIQSIQNIHI